MVVKTYENLSVIEAARQAGFDMLVDAAEKAGLTEILETSQNITVFAPDDNAFNIIEKTVLGGMLKVENKDKLANILKNHVVSSSMTLDEITSLDEIQVMNGNMVSVNRRNSHVLLNDARIIQPDIQTKNGIIHSIDKVIMPD